MPPAISIVIPAYNREKYIGAAIKSMLAQTRGDFELVVWDDGSFDGTVAAAKDAAGVDPRVRVIAAEHGGTVAALTGAIAITSGQYLGSLDSDDLLAPTALAETSAVLDAQPDIG